MQNAHYNESVDSESELTDLPFLWKGEAGINRGKRKNVVIFMLCSVVSIYPIEQKENPSFRVRLLFQMVHFKSPKEDLPMLLPAESSVLFGSKLSHRFV